MDPWRTPAKTPPSAGLWGWTEADSRSKSPSGSRSAADKQKAQEAFDKFALEQSKQSSKFKTVSGRLQAPKPVDTPKRRSTLESLVQDTLFKILQFLHHRELRDTISSASWHLFSLAHCAAFRQSSKCLSLDGVSKISLPLIRKTYPNLNRLVLAGSSLKEAVHKAKHSMSPFEWLVHK